MLPTEKQSPTITPENAVVLAYAEPGLGKTTLGADDHTLILATEPGAGGLEAFVHPVTSWEEFLAVGQELAKGKHHFKRVHVDTADQLQMMCQAHVIAGYNRGKAPSQRISHPSDLEYGKMWDALSREWRRLAGFCQLGFGVTFTSHAKEVEIEKPVGKVTRWVPSLTGSAAKWLLGYTEFIFFIEKTRVDGKEVRVLHSQPSERYVAKARVQRPMEDPLIIESENPLDAGRILYAAMRDATKVQSKELAPA
jgi:hypothetical protein